MSFENDFMTVVETLAVLHENEPGELGSRRRLLIRTARILPLLEQLENPMVKPDGGNHTRSNGVAAPSAARLPILDLLNALHESLTGIARTVSRFDGVSDKVICLQLVDSDRLDRKGIKPLFDGLEATLRKAEQAVSPPLPSVIVGLCPACRMLLRATDGQTTTRCPACRSQWDARYVRVQTHLRMLEDTSLMTTGQGEKLLAMTGLKVSRKTIQSWHQKGWLNPVTVAGNKPMYRVCDMWKLATRKNRKENKS